MLFDYEMIKGVYDNLSSKLEKIRSVIDRPLTLA